MNLVSKLLLLLDSILGFLLNVLLSLFDRVLESQGVVFRVVRSYGLKNDAILAYTLGQLVAPDLVRLAIVRLREGLGV